LSFLALALVFTLAVVEGVEPVAAVVVKSREKIATLLRDSLPTTSLAREFVADIMSSSNYI
jgi:hypothetical protein